VVKQPYAVSSRLWATTANASRKATSSVRNLWSFLAVVTLLMLSSALLILGATADNSTDARYNDLGHKLMCTCESVPATGMGLARCQQIVVECTHHNCTVSPRMRGELRAAVQRGDKDDMILQSFVKEYGTSVLAVPPAVDKLLWLMAFVGIVAIASFVVAFVRKRQSRPAIVATPE
jgi:cytochrome c-type biogenesis protein CcmH/NrfF